MSPELRDRDCLRGGGLFVQGFEGFEGFRAEVGSGVAGLARERKEVKGRE